MSSQQNTGVLPEGTRILWYEIVKVLGKGGFGVTYLGRDTNLNQLVAIKEFLPSGYAVREQGGTRVVPTSSANAQHYEWGLNRFVQEAQILARFKHPNIVRVLSFFRENSTAYMVMEYEEGEGLDKILLRRRALPEDELTRLFNPLLDGLDVLHEANLIHRDLKPANIFIRKDNSPVLLDFGSARQAVTGQANQDMTSLLSLGYSPFEQYDSSGARQGPWSDIYSMAAVLYRAISGDKPLDAALRISARLRNEPDPMRPVTLLAAGRYSARFLAAVDKGLMVLETERPQNIKEWRALFQQEARPEPAPEPVDDFAPRSGGNGRESPAQERRSGGLSPGGGGSLSKPKKSAWQSFVSSLDDFVGSKPTATGQNRTPPTRPERETPPRAEPRTPAKAPERETTLAPERAPAVEDVFAEARIDPRTAQFQTADNRPPPLRERRPGQIWVERISGIEFVWIPGGTFLMGSPPSERGRREDEGPVHEVEVNGFWMGRFPITWGQWKAVMGAPKRDYTREMDNYPIEKVLWEDAQQFVRKLVLLGGERSSTIRLPTEAEWEYAARAGASTAFHFGDNPERLGEFAWFVRNSNEHTHPVGLKLPNDWGLFDMLGNVWEWTSDWYGEDYYSVSPGRNPKGAPGGVIRVRRGGSWRSDIYACRSAHRNRVAAYAQSNALGFRLVREDDSQE